MRDQRISVIIISFLTVYFTVFMTKERHYYMIVINVFFAQKSEHLPALDFLQNFTRNSQNNREKTHAPFARGMTTSSKRAKADVGLVSFKDLCTLLDKIKTYRKREGKKTKKAIAKDYLDKFFENHYPQFFKGERRDMFRLYRLFAPQVTTTTTTTTTLFLSFAFLYLSLSLFVCYSRFARSFRGLDKFSFSLSLLST